MASRPSGRGRPQLRGCAGCPSGCQAAAAPPAPPRGSRPLSVPGPAPWRQPPRWPWKGTRYSNVETSVSTSIAVYLAVWCGSPYVFRFLKYHRNRGHGVCRAYVWKNNVIHGRGDERFAGREQEEDPYLDGHSHLALTMPFQSHSRALMAPHHGAVCNMLVKLLEQEKPDAVVRLRCPSPPSGTSKRGLQSHPQARTTPRASDARRARGRGGSARSAGATRLGGR